MIVFTLFAVAVVPPFGISHGSPVAPPAVSPPHAAPPTHAATLQFPAVSINMSSITCYTGPTQRKLSKHEPLTFQFIALH